MKLKCIAVTGATGFLGSHLTDRLLADGYRVRLLTRDAARASRWAGTAAETVVGDITDAAVLDRLMDGCDAAVHLVSNFRVASGPPESYRAINVHGTRNALRAAGKAGVGRFVHCSTIGVHGHVRSTPAREDSDFNPGDLYQETKAEAERIVLEAAGSGQPEIVVIRPCSMYGPGDMRMLKMFRMLQKRTFFLVGPCQENFHAVYIDDIVDGFMRALEVPSLDGEVFIVGGPGYLSLESYIAEGAAAVDAPSPWLRLPYWPLYCAAVACEAICVPLRIEPPLHRRRVRFYRNNRAFSIDKAEQVLDYHPRVPLAEGMRKTVAWYRSHGYL